MTATECRGSGTIEHLDQRYDEVEGVDPNLLSLDLYEPVRAAGCPAAPIVVYVHGGGFRNGDKSNQVDDKVRLFNDEGWLFASLNYRLSPDPIDLDDAEAVRYPTHLQDLANAMAWLRDNAGRYGGDPQQFLLTGHSAGALLVTQLSTDESFLEAEGMSLADVTCTSPLDTEGYDVSAEMAGDDRRSKIYRNAFGDDPGVWEQASPLTNVEPGEEIPDFLVIVQGSDERTRKAQDFVDALRVADVPATLVDADPYTHLEVNEAVGKPGDEIVTPPLMDFFRMCVTTPVN